MIILVLVVIGISGCVDSGTTTNDQTEMNVVVSETMAPTFHRGDIVIVTKNTTNIQIGDIIIYNATWFPDPVIHRVISIQNDSNGNIRYELKGDNNPKPDPELVSPNQITYKVVNTNNGPQVIPKLGYITLWLRGL
nr:signal peptidase I [uncultured Methanobacterium sp.]